MKLDLKKALSDAQKISSFIFYTTLNSHGY